MKNNKNNNCNFPTLRFPEFEGEWDEVLGNELFKPVSNKKHDSDLPIVAVTQTQGVALRDEIDFKISVSDKSISTYKIVEKGDFVISLRSFQGGIEYSEVTGICSPAYTILKPILPIVAPFYKSYLKQNRYISKLNERLEGIRDGKNISFENFSIIPLPYPSLEEQDKIARFLSLIGERIATQNKIIAHLESLIKGLSQIVFENNEGWRESAISEVASVVSGGTPDTSIPSFWGGDINWFTPSEIGRVKYVNSSNRTITENGLKDSSAKLLPPNSLLLSTRATIGECSICQSTCTTNQGFQSLVATHVDYEFLYYFMRTKKSELIKKSSGSTFSEISANEVKQLKIFIPTINTQKQIANLLKSVDEKITIETKVLSAYNLQKQTLLQRLFI